MPGSEPGLTLEISGQTRVYALIGRPVAHSLSPAMHNAWFRHYGVDAVYVALPSPPGRSDVAEAIRTLGLAGANLTIPHKSSAFLQCDTVDDPAGRCRAVNTVVNDGGRLLGGNTDVNGFLDGVAEIGLDLSGAVVRVLGAGGAAAAVGAAALQAGADRVVFVNRSRARATSLIDHFGTKTRFEQLEPHLRLPAHTDVVINTLPRGGRALAQQIQTDQLRSATAWIDLNYWDAAPPHVSALAARGHAVQTGHAMLLYQAARSFERFTGINPDTSLVLDQLMHHGAFMARPVDPR